MISAVILVYNRCDEALITIAKLEAYALLLPYPMEIIVVDNASIDDTTAKVSALHPGVKLITKQKNNGIAGWNDGFAVAKYPYMLVLDDDSHPETGIAEAVGYLEDNPNTGILALNITTGPYLTDEWIWKNGKPWEHEEEIIGFFGCGALIRRTVYEKIGGFSEWMLVYGHEWDYGIRCIDAGYKVIYFKKSSIVHRASLINRSLKRARVYGTRNDLAIIYIYFGEKRWKYIGRVILNNLKRAKHESLQSAWYDILGTIEFLRFRGTLKASPVSPETRSFFANSYMNTNPVLGFITKKFTKWPGKQNK